MIPAETQIQDRWLPTIRLVWVALAILLAAILFAGLGPRYRELAEVCRQEPCPVLALIAALAEGFLQAPPYEGRIPLDKIVPHLRVAHASDPAELEALRASFTARVAPHLPLRLTADEVWLMDDRDGRWEKRRPFHLSAK